MNIAVYGSSSSGNCVRVVSRDGLGIYIDAGVFPQNLKTAHAPIANATFLITHEHGDHAKYVKPLADRFGCYFAAPEQTLAKFNIAPRRKIVINPGQSICRNGAKIEAFPVVHDNAANPVGYIIEMDGERLLYMTDIGKLPSESDLPQCDIYFIEANYTPKKIRDNILSGKVPQTVAERTISGFGHIGLDQAIRFVEPRAAHATKIIFGHISRQNFDFEEAKTMIPPEIKKKIRYAQAGAIYTTLWGEADDNQ